MNKFKAFLNRLNGWQRLFVVYLIFIHIPFTIFLIYDDSPAAPTTEVLLESLQKSKVTKEPKFKTKLLSRDEMYETIPGYSETYRDAINRMEKDGSIVSIQLEQPSYYWDYTLVMHREVPPWIRYETAQFLNEELHKAYVPAKLKSALNIFWKSALAATLLYSLGFSIGWIFRGFFRRKET